MSFVINLHLILLIIIWKIDVTGSWWIFRELHWAWVTGRPQRKHESGKQTETATWKDLSLKHKVKSPSFWSWEDYVLPPFISAIFAWLKRPREVLRSLVFLGENQ
jgi:hypothetical protein